MIFLAPKMDNYQNSKVRMNSLPRPKACQNNFGATKILRPTDIPNLKPCEHLFLLAHPDDESCFFGFIAKFLKEKKDSVQVVYTTSGQKGRDIREIYQRYDPRIKIEREKELLNASNEYHMERDPMILDMMDGETHYPENRESMDVLFEQVIDNVKPKNVYTFDPTGMTGHSDHIATSDVVSDVLKREKHSKYQGIKLWQVAYTEKKKNEVINTTKAETHIFTFARHSITKPDRQIDISENIPEVINAFKQYHTQFSEKACETLRTYFTNNPLVDLILKK